MLWMSHRPDLSQTELNLWKLSERERGGDLGRKSGDVAAPRVRRQGCRGLREQRGLIYAACFPSEHAPLMCDTRGPEAVMSK